MGIVDQINSLQKQMDRLKAKVCCIDTSGGGTTIINNNNPLANTVISGGIVTWLQDYDYEVSAAVYNIGGVQYSSPVTDITLASADPTNDRIDVFVLTTSGTAIALEGTPSVNPQEPNEDIDTQLPVSFAIVSAGTTAPVPTVSDENIYFENVEWTTSSNSANIVANSTNNPFAGTLDVEGTNVTTGNQIVFTAPSVPNYADYDLLTFKIRSKAGWVKKRLQIQWLSGTTLMGNQVVFGEGTYGFVSTNTATYQTISIPLSAFGTISGSNKLRIRRSGTGTIGFYLDNIRLTTTNVINNPPATDTLTRFGIEDNTIIQNRSFNFSGFDFSFLNLGATSNASSLIVTDSNKVKKSAHLLPAGSDYIPLSVNSNFADSAGNITIAGLPSVVLADNGLHVDGGSGAVYLGGTLLQDTLVEVDNFLLTVLGTANTPALTILNVSTGVALSAVATSGLGVDGQSTSGAGVTGTSVTSVGTRGYSTDAAAGLFVSTNYTGIDAQTYNSSGFASAQFTTGAGNASVSTVLQNILLRRVASDIATNGIGSSIDFDTTTSSSNDYSNKIISKWTDATHATRTSEFSITGVNSGVTTRKLALSGTGKLTLDGYGSGTFTGTATKNLQVDASGNVIEGALGGGAGRFGIEDIIGVQDRAMDMQQFTLSITSSNGTDSTQILLNPSRSALLAGDFIDYAGNEQEMGVESAGNNAYMYVQSATDWQRLQIEPTIAQLIRNGTSYNIPISVNGVVAASTGNIPLVKTTDDYANDGAAATGGIPVGGLYHTSGTVKIRLT